MATIERATEIRRPYEHAYPNPVYFNEVDEDKHFAAWQEPELFTNELRAAFRSLRDERRSS